MSISFIFEHDLVGGGDGDDDDEDHEGDCDQGLLCCFVLFLSRWLFFVLFFFFF